MRVVPTPTRTIDPSVQSLNDSELVSEVSRRAGRERLATADLIRALIEFDRRQLYLAEGYGSLFAYCTQVLHYSEGGAFNRIEVARAAARWPQLLASLEDGSLHLAGARLLAPHLTEENIDLALEAARHKSKREIEEVAARLAQRSILIAVAAEQYRLHLTISRAARDTLLEVQALMSHRVPDANAAIIFEQALSVLLEKLQGTPSGDPPSAPAKAPRATVEPKVRSRHIPAAVKRQVRKRDGGRCAFVGRQGRCPERRYLHFHHVLPYAVGGPPTVDNIQLRCAAHNAHEAKGYFGAEAVAAARERKSGRSGKRLRSPGSSRDELTMRGAAKAVKQQRE